MGHRIKSEYAVNYGKAKGFHCDEHKHCYVLSKPQQNHNEFLIKIEREHTRIYKHNDELVERTDTETVTVTIIVPKGGLTAWLWRRIKKLIDDS